MLVYLYVWNAHLVEKLDVDLTQVYPVSCYTEEDPAQKTSIAPVICYESIYGEFTATQVRKGAELLCVLTNDGWWGDTPGYKQHFSFSRLRAIETRRWVIRSANTGTSGIINEYGEVMAQTLYWKPAVLSATVPLLKTQTIFSQQGDYIGRSFSFVAVLIILFAFSKKLKNNLSN